MRRFHFVLLGLLLGSACGDDSSPPPPPPPPPPPGDMDLADMRVRDSGEDMRRPDASDAGDLGDASDMSDMSVDAPRVCNTPSGPQVTIMAPVAATNPNDDTVVSSSRITVECQVQTPASADAVPIAPESVSIVRLGEADSVVDAPAVNSEGDIFRAAFNLSDVDNGPLRFRCSADDILMPPRCGDAVRDTLLDLGPTVTVLEPREGSIHTDTMSLRYRIAEAPLSDADAEADVTGHTLTVAGVRITDIETVSPGEFLAAIDFTDASVFEEDLAGDFVFTIEASNARTPEAATRRIDQGFTIDRTGPTIEVVTPEEGDLIGGRVQARVTIVDPAGVAPESAILRVGMLELALRDLGDEDSSYEVFFDAAVFPSTITELTLNFTAADAVGNRSTVSQVVKLDARAPLASLTPPDVREATRSGLNLRCGPFFDPVGRDSVEDAQVLGTAAEFRARVEDLTNEGATGTSVLFHAGTRSVDLYILDDVDQALVVDETGDGVCDSINPEFEPDPGDPATAVVVELEGIRPRGTIFVPPAESFPIGSPAAAYTTPSGTVYDVCDEGGTTTMPPRPLCDASSPVPRIIPPRIVSTDESAIWGKPVIGPLTCLGDSFDYQSSISNGWACVAIRTEDNLGNIGVSAPIRVCFTNDPDDPDPCPGPPGTTVDPSTLPSCTDGCTPLTFTDFLRYQLVLPR